MNKKLEAWPGKCLSSVRTAHGALSHLYNGLEVEESDESVAKGDKGHVGIPSQEGWNSLQAAAAFTRCCKELIALLSSPLDGAIRLPLGRVFKLVTRCLQVTYSDVVPIPSLKDLCSVLPGVQQTALDVLAYLILCCRTNLLPRSRDIIELCLQTLSSSEKMEAQARSTTRAHVYRVMSLWLETAGLGRHYLNKVKDIHRELVSDIIADKALTKPSNGSLAQEATDSNVHRKKNKGKKKGSRRAESYLDSVFADSTKEDAKPQTPQNVLATLGALKVTQLAVERGKFSSIQGLIRSVEEMALTLQRQLPSDLSPYAEPEVRSSLYQALYACSVVPLDNTNNSADTVYHFQLTSRALSLMVQAACSDPSVQVQRVCQGLLCASKCIGSVNRPIVRKVLLEEQVEFGDVMEMERQMEQAKEEKETLKKKVLELEIDSQRQTRLNTELQEEIETLKAKLAKHKTQGNISSPDLDISQSSPTPGTDEVSEEEGEEEKEEQIEGIDNEEEMESSKKERDGEKVSEVDDEGEIPGKGQDNALTDTGSGRKKQEIHSKLMKEEEGEKVEKKKKKKDKGKGKSKKKLSEGLGESDMEDASSASSQKRAMPSTSEESSSVKKSRMEDDEQQSADVQEMLLDFVDADPDEDSD